MTAHLTIQQRALAHRLRAKGMSLRGIAKEIGCGHSGIDVMLRGQIGAAKPIAWTPRQGRLTVDEREEILIGLHRGESLTDIAKQLGRAPSTVSREVKANGGRGCYRIWPAHIRAHESTKRPKPSKLSNEALCAKVTGWLESLWSPEEIAHRLRKDFPDDPTMQISSETIYQSLFVQGRGELRKELTRCLRSGRTNRRPQGHVKHPGPVANKVMISERPSEANDRAVPGHWEGDLIIGSTSTRSAIGTLVERTSGFVMLLHLPGDHTALTVSTAMIKAMNTLPDQLRRSVTWDQGREMAKHQEITMATGIPIYFCDPHSPWQRGGNENTNGLLEWSPKVAPIFSEGYRPLHPQPATTARSCQRAQRPPAQNPSRQHPHASHATTTIRPRRTQCCDDRLNSPDLLRTAKGRRLLVWPISRELIAGATVER